MPGPQLLAAVDLGSNSFRLLIGRVETSALGQQVLPLDSLKEPVRLAAGLDAQGNIDADAQKRALGALGEAAVRLFAPVSGKLGLAEGVESAMSAYALTGIPVWATLGNERFGLVSVPESVTELHLFVDHDAGGELAASRGLAAYAREGRTIHVRKPSSRDSDWNDELTAWLRRKAAR